MINLDFNNRLLVWDYDRIRRVDLGTGIITNFIGGGASTGDSVAPGAISLSSIIVGGIRDSYTYATMLLDPLPNGDLYFRSEGSWPNMTGTTGGVRIRKYTQSTGTITSIYPQGIGASGNASRVLSGSNYLYGGFGFDPITSTINIFAATIADFVASTWVNYAGLTFDPTTGISNGAGPHAPVAISTYSTDAHYLPAKNGSLYYYSGRATEVKKYNSGSNTWTTLNARGLGYCPDGTTFSSCDMRLQDFYVTASGRMYMVDNRMIRYVDKSNKVQTIFGQSYYNGSGGQAISARIGDADWIEQRADGKLIYADLTSAQIHEMTIGGTTNLVAGNGLVGGPALSPTLAINTSNNYRQYSNDRGMAINPANGDIFIAAGTNIIRLDRATGKWVIGIGGGTTCASDPASDGLAVSKFTGTSNGVDCTNSTINLFGFDGTNILVSLGNYLAGVNYNPYMKLFNISNNIQTHLMGAQTSGFASPMANWCADGTGNNCTTFPNGQYANRNVWDSGNSRWLMASNTSRTIKAFPLGGVISTYDQTTAGHQIHGFAVRFGAPDMYYYCNTVDGLLYRKTIGGATVNLPFGSPSITCTSETVTWDSARTTAIFGVTQNGLSAVAEYYDP